MAYPSVNFQPTSSFMGLQPINVASTTQAQVLGTVIRARDVTYGEGEFIYLAGVASTAAGDAVCYNSKTGATARAVSAGATSIGAFGIAMAATTAGLFGWYQISGSGPINAASTAANTQAFLTATAGQIDDTGSGAISGLTITAATSAGFATVQIDRPAVNPSDSGTNTGDVTLTAVGSTPAAAGASLAGQVLTLQPADATHPGVVTSAAQPFGGAKTFDTTVHGPGFAPAATASTTQGLDVSTSNTYVRATNPGQVNLGVDADNIRITTGVVRFDAVPALVLVFASSDSSGSPGAATIDKTSGRSALASGSGSAGIDITNATVVGATSRVFITPRAIDGTAPLFTGICAAGKFTVKTFSALGVATNLGANWAFDWFVIN